MLLDKNSRPNLGDVITIRLVDGVEIVGKMDELGADSVTVSKPMQIHMHPTNEGIGIAFGPVLGSRDDFPTLKFQFSALSVRPIKTGEQVAKNYLQATSSIQIPSAKETSIIAS